MIRRATSASTPIVTRDPFGPPLRDERFACREKDFFDGVRLAD